ncbi:MAG: InlB B-repeat-containing protein [Pyrinomonadaceae bacterium]
MDKSVARLKTEHNRLEAIASNPETHPDVRAINAELLKKNESLLREALLKSIAALESYARSIADISDADDLTNLREQIEGNRYDLARLNGSKTIVVPEGFNEATSDKEGVKALSKSSILVDYKPVSKNAALANAKKIETFPIKSEKKNEPIGRASKSPTSLLKYTLSVVIVNASAGKGRVKSSGSGAIDCGSVCDADYSDGTAVTLSAQPEKGHTFTGWSDSACGANKNCTVNMDRDITINATFNGPAGTTSTGSPLNKNLQAYFGTEIVGASSAASDAQPFFNLKLFVPIRNINDCDEVTENKLCFAFWSDFRFASSPTQTLPNFASLSGSTISSFVGGNQSTSINSLVKSFQTKIGVEFGTGRGFSLIAGAGITSPLSSRQSLQAYKIPRNATTNEVLPAFTQIFGPVADNIQNLILTSGERDRFQRNWFVGGRLRHSFYRDDSYPGEFDLTFGQDEVMTRKLIGGVLKFDATVPIKIGDSDFLYFGAGFNLKLTRRVNVFTAPFFLEPNANYNLYTDTNLIKNFSDTPFGTSNRDTYSFRIGVDLIRLFKKGGTSSNLQSNEKPDPSNNKAKEADNVTDTN